jgi:cytochrome c553
MNKNIKQIYPRKKVISALTIAICLIFCLLSVRGQDPKISELKKFYQTTCVKCHGTDGSAVGEDGKKLKGQDFTDRQWQQDTKDEEMVKIIHKGKFFGLAMPAFNDKLSDEEIQLIVTDIIRKAEKGKTIAP